MLIHGLLQVLKHIALATLQTFQSLAHSIELVGIFLELRLIMVLPLHFLKLCVEESSLLQLPSIMPNVLRFLVLADNCSIPLLFVYYFDVQALLLHCNSFLLELKHAVVSNL